VSPATGFRSFLDSLSRDPGADRSARFAHHGARVALLLLLASATYLFFPLSPVPDFPMLEKGMLVEQDVIAEVPFKIGKTSEELSRERDEAAAAVAPIFRYDSTAIDTMRVRVATIMGHLDASAESAAPAERLRQTLAAYSLPTRDDVVALLRPAANRTALRRSLERIVEQEMKRSIAHPNDLENLRTAHIRVLRDDFEQTLQRDSIPTPSSLFASGDRYLPANTSAGLGPIQQLILIRQFTPTLRLDRAATETARQNARAAVTVVKGEVIRGERIVAAREQLRAEDIEVLRAYRSELAAQGAFDTGFTHLRHVLGSVMLAMLVLGAFGCYLLLFRRVVYRNLRHVLVIGALAFILIGIAAGVTRGTGPIELIPIALPTLVLAVLWDGRLAFSFAMVMALLLGVQPPLSGLSAGVYLVAGGAAASLSVRAVRRRAQALALGGIVAGAYAFAVLSLGLLLAWSAREMGMHALWGTVNGIACAVFALGLLPVFESLTRITSDQTLLELADLNRPLLKRLSVEASGTYAHSINVANLAEAASRAIGGKPLLARVGAYYHDVGKILNPQYYVENQGRGPNPHDRLHPADSAAIVKQHVSDGLRLAQQDNLPDAVRAFIPEHHGTQPIGFFLEQARQADPHAVIEPAQFSYDGPLPRTAETAIVLLADSVESAAKVLADPTPERIRGLVERIVEGKIAQGQLAETPLTMADLTRIKEQFVIVLEGMYHRRLDYPPAPRPPADATAVVVRGAGAD
jgi:putative nucleotidyltransferase with HDIG domain